MTGNQNIPDTDLIQGCLTGDRKMQEELYSRFSPKMYAVCLRYATNAEEAQDLLQEGFIKIFKNLEKFRHEGSFEGWMRRVFVNTSIESYRKRVNVNTITERDEIRIEDSSWNALDNLAEKDIVRLVQDLSPGYRTVFNMYVIEGYSHKEIANTLGITEGTSKSQLARAKGILQKRVTELIDSNRKPLLR